MVSGANATVAYLHEPEGDYTGSPSDTDYKVPGIDCTIDEVSIDNALDRLRTPGDPEAADTIATSFEGAFTISFTLGNPWWLNHVFGAPPTGTGPYTWEFESGTVQSARFYVGVDFINGTAERVLKGVVFGGLQLQCEVGNTVQAQLTGFYADEQRNSSITPGSTPSEGDDPLVYHGATIEVPNSTTLQKIQDFTLDIQTGARPAQGLDRKPVEAVMGAIEHELTVNKVVTSTDQLNPAYGNTTAPATTVDGAANATIEFQGAASSGTRQEYQLTHVTPNDYNWQNIGNPEEDISEAITYYVDSITAVAESNDSGPR
jgi:hypothetical protein